MPWIERVRDLQPLDAALDVANPLLKRLVSAINPVSGIDGAVTIPITRYGTINNQPTPFGVGAKSSSIAASNALYSTISSIGAADSTIILVVYNHALIADANNHFAGGSYRSGSLTTAIQLSNGAGTHYWQALTGNGSINTLSSNEVLPVGLSVLAHTQRGGLISIYRNGVLKNSTSAANGNSNDTFCICDIDGPALPNSTDRAILLGLKIAGALSASELAAIGSNPWQLFEKERIWVPVAAGGDTYTLTADSGSFALTGQDTALNFNRTLAADSGSFALTGQAAALTFNRALVADSGSFALAGQDATPTFSRVLSAASGSYALAGQDATLTYTPISGATYTLAAASGSFALAGQDVVLAYNRVLSAANGSYLLTGQNATLVGPGLFTQAQLDYMLAYCQANMTGILKRWNGSAWV